MAWTPLLSSQYNKKRASNIPFHPSQGQDSGRQSELKLLRPPHTHTHIIYIYIYMPHGSRNKGELDKWETEIGGQSPFFTYHQFLLCVFSLLKFLFGLIGICNYKSLSNVKGWWRGAFQLSSFTMKVSFSVMAQSSLPPLPCIMHCYRFPVVHALMRLIPFPSSVHEPN